MVSTLLFPKFRNAWRRKTCSNTRVNLTARFAGMTVIRARVIEACAPRLKVISKWGTGIDSIDAEACSRYGIKTWTHPERLHHPGCRHSAWLHAGLCPPPALDGQGYEIRQVGQNPWEGAQ